MTATATPADFYAMLHHDQVDRYQVLDAGGRTALDAWMQGNVLHAIDGCPKALALWKETQRDGIFPVDTILYRYVGAALEYLDDKTKAGILLGCYEGEAQAGLFHHIKDGKNNNWTSLSPAWVGPPGSALRQAAESKKWTPFALIGQVPHAIARPEAERWSQWVPYAQSIAFIHRGSMVEWMMKKRGESLPVEALQTQAPPWAIPEDMALTQSLIGRHPGFRYAVKVHAQAAPVSAELQERMNLLVSVHANLGIMPALMQAVVAGALPGFEQHATMALPQLD